MARAYYPDQVQRYGFYQRSPSPSDGFSPKIICHDCPEKTFGVGCTQNLWSFKTYHLTRNTLHGERVEARILQEAPIEKLREKAAKLQQAREDREGF
jgi:hypothetical protein